MSTVILQRHCRRAENSCVKRKTSLVKCQFEKQDGNRINRINHPFVKNEGMVFLNHPCTNEHSRSGKKREKVVS